MKRQRRNQRVIGGRPLLPEKMKPIPNATLVRVDMLPPPVRAALVACDFVIDPRYAHRMINRGIAFEKIAATIASIKTQAQANQWNRGELDQPPESGGYI